MAVRSAETKSAPIPKYANTLSLITAAEARFHLLIKPASPGTPIRPREAMVKIPNTTGILLPKPSISCTYCFPVLYITAPTQKKEQIFITAWNTIWLKAPTSPMGVIIQTPKRI